MTTKKEKAPAQQSLATVTTDGYRLAKTDAKQLLATVAENFGPGGLSPADLERIKVPSGGAQSWETTDPLTGEVTPVKAITGIIIAWAAHRAYWAARYSGGSEPPQCSSTDAIHGVGDPGGDCLRCPMAQYGTATNADGTKGSGQACNETRQVLLVRPGPLLPSILSIPATSIAPFRKYLVALSDRSLSFRQVVTSFALKAEQSATNIKYSSIVPTYTGVLPADMQARAAELGATLKHLLTPPAPQAGDPDSWANAPRTTTPAKTN